MTTIRVDEPGRLTTKRQANGCYCAEKHSTPRAIVVAFAACRHPSSQIVYLGLDGVDVADRAGLPLCSHCGAHRRASDGAWVYGHLASCASTAGQRLMAKKPPAISQAKKLPAISQAKLEALRRIRDSAGVGVREAMALRLQRAGWARLRTLHPGHGGWRVALTDEGRRVLGSFESARASMQRRA